MRSPVRLHQRQIGPVWACRNRGRVSAIRGSAVRKRASRLALRVLSILNEEPAVTKSRFFNTLLTKLIKSTYQVLAYRDVSLSPPPETIDESTCQNHGRDLGP